MSFQPQVSVIMGSDSDLSVMADVASFLADLGVEHELTIVSAHRTPDRLYRYASAVAERGVKVIVAGAGGAAHLPGMVASLTHLPVIGVPIKTSSLHGLDSLYSIVQMPPGVPVATVAINGAKNAAILACQILALYDGNLAKRLKSFKESMNVLVKEKAAKLEAVGYERYNQAPQSKHI